MSAFCSGFWSFLYVLLSSIFSIGSPSSANEVSVFAFFWAADTRQSLPRRSLMKFMMEVIRCCPSKTAYLFVVNNFNGCLKAYRNAEKFEKFGPELIAFLNQCPF